MREARLPAPLAGRRRFAAVVATTALLVILAACAGCGRSGGAAPATRTAGGPTPAAADTSTPEPDWYAAELPEAGVRFDVPSVLSPGHPAEINGNAGKLIAWAYTGSPASSPLKRAAAQATVIAQYSSQITNDDICPSGGDRVALGSGLAGYQQTDVSPGANGPPASYPYFRVSTVLNGEAIQLELHAPGRADDTFTARYGDIWRHMLASFAPLPNQPISKNRPCG